MNTETLIAEWREIEIAAKSDKQLAAILKAREVLKKAGVELQTINGMAKAHYKRHLKTIELVNEAIEMGIVSRDLGCWLKSPN